MLILTGKERGRCCISERHSSQHTRGLVGTGNAGILGELVDVAVRRPEVHPADTAWVFLLKENLDSPGAELAGGSIDVVNKKADNWSGGEVAVEVAVGSKDLYFAAIRQLEHLKPRTIKVPLEAQDVSEEVSRRFEVLGARAYPGELDDFHTHRGTGQSSVMSTELAVFRVSRVSACC